MADLIGTKSDIDVELYAMGSYNSELNSIDIEWITNYTNSSYEVWTSDDNDDYTSTAIVTDTTTYQYIITDDFEKRYFKIPLTTNYGEYIESIPFVATKTEEGYKVDFLDSDGDGIPDVLEIMLGTDANESDTDNDGLTDFQEIYITGTDPVVFDSVTEGVSDADADYDGDGVSNIDEIEIGTDPQDADTDSDGLLDYDELYIYGTDPLNPDTDGDRLEDGDELYIGLDPINPETFGIPDAEYKVDQTISADSYVLKEINTAENAYELSMDIKTNGYAENVVTVTQSSYAHTIQNDTMIGLSAEISASDTCNPEKIVLKHNIKETYINNTLNMYSSLEEFQGIKRLNIFRFYEDTNMLLPINTEFDAENDLLYAEVDELGTYCLMDMEIWLNNLGVEMTEEDTPAMFNMNSAADDSVSSWTPTYVNTPVDLVFLLQTTGSSSYYFEKEKTVIKDFCHYVFSTKSDVNVYIITYDLDTGSILKESGSSILDNDAEVASALNSITYTDHVTAYCDRGQAFKLLQTEMCLRDDADTFIYQLVNGATSSYSGYDNAQVIEMVKNHQYTAYSEIGFPGWHYLYQDAHDRITAAIAANGDLFIDMDNDTVSKLTNHLEGKVSSSRQAYEIITPTNWKTIYLDGELSPNNSIDTDGDCLTDWEEVDQEKLIWNEDGSFALPIYKISDSFKYMGRFSGSSYVFLSGSKIFYSYLPILSNPAETDTDNDGYSDAYDIDKMRKNDYTFLDNEIYHIGQINGTQYQQVEVNSVFVKSPAMMNDEENIDSQKFKFKWCGTGYKIYPIDGEKINKVLTLNRTGSSYEIIVDTDSNLPEQIWEVLPRFFDDPYGQFSDGLILRSKYVDHTASLGKPLFLTSSSNTLIASTARDDNTKFKLYSPCGWTRFGEAYLNCYGWQHTLIYNSEGVVSFENYSQNTKVGLDTSIFENDPSTGKDYIICQGGGTFSQLKYASSKMSDTGCGIIATYNAMTAADVEADFFKLALEFEYNAIYSLPVIGGFVPHGRTGSDPYKIKNCLEAYHLSYTFYDVSNYALNDSLACSAFDKDLKSGKSGIVYFGFPAKFLNNKIKIPIEFKHFISERYNPSNPSNPIKVYNLFNNSTSSGDYVTTMDSVKNNDPTNRKHFIIGYVIR